MGCDVIFTPGITLYKVADPET